MLTLKNITSRCMIIGLVLISLQVVAKTGTSDDKLFPSLIANSGSDAPVMKRMADSIYDRIGLVMYGLEKDVFFSAFKGYQYLQQKGMLRKKNMLTICDYSQSSNNKRLYVIDLANLRLLFHSFVSHGKNSGGEFATSFSNIKESNKSSLGFMITAETYSGKAGLSMRFDGAEPGINDKVRYRDIVFHGSRFVNESVMENKGMIGNSLGCPAVPYGLHTRIINIIKGGSCFYINHPDAWYNHTSAILNAKFDVIPPQPNAHIALQQLQEENMDASILKSTPLQ